MFISLFASAGIKKEGRIHHSTSRCQSNTERPWSYVGTLNFSPFTL